MFRLLDSGLPKDPVYPASWEELGYFINEEDEIRSIKNPRAYFNFFLTKNDRYNAVHREAMNGLIREEVYRRLHKLGLNKVRIPLGATETEAHIPILISSDIAKKKRVIILFYEHCQDLGIFAYRIVGGRGGINEGSAVNFVKYIKSLSGPDSPDSPGIILANLGQLKWWRRGRRAVTHTTWFSLPQKNAVSGPIRFDAVKNTVPGNRNTAEHVAYIFDTVVKELVASEAMLEVIGVSVGAVDVVEYLNKPQNWESMQPRMTAVALVATFHQVDDITNPSFAEWLRKRGRAYVTSHHPINIPVAGPNGNIRTNPDDNTIIVSDCYGCPTYSLGEPYYSELMLPKGYKAVLDWFQEVVFSEEGYENPEVVIAEDIRDERTTIEEKESEESIDKDAGGEGVKKEKAKKEVVNVVKFGSKDFKGEEVGRGKSEGEEIKGEGCIDENSNEDEHKLADIKEEAVAKAESKGKEVQEEETLEEEHKAEIMQ